MLSSYSYQPILQFLTNDSSKYLETNLTQQNTRRTQIVNQTMQNQLFKLPKHASLLSDLSPSIQKDEDHYYQLAPGEGLLYEEAIPTSLLIMGPTEGLVLVFKACWGLSIVLTAPFWGWIWLQFILPGLRQSERGLLFPFLSCSVICLCLGIAFAYYFTLPLANRALLAFNLSIGQNAWTLTHYVNYVLFLCLGHAIAAELGLLYLCSFTFAFFPLIVSFLYDAT